MEFKICETETETETETLPIGTYEADVKDLMRENNDPTINSDAGLVTHVRQFFFKSFGKIMTLKSIVMLVATCVLQFFLKACLPILNILVLTS